MKFYPIEHPVVCQLGGNNPEKLKQCALFCQELGYDEININLGCPSPKVQEGSFGACLMKDVDHVIKMIKEMKNGVQVPITVKCRLGVDECDSYEYIKEFIIKIWKETKLDIFIIHARKAFLKVI